MLIKTTRFGDIDINDADIILFPEGLIGFHEARRFVILNHKQDKAFKWLQNVDDGALAFIIVNPNQFMVEYAPEFLKTDLDFFQVEKGNELEIYSIVVVPKDPLKMSANLLGPIVINPKNHLGKQIILSTGQYTTCHYIVDEIIANSRGVNNACVVQKT